MICAQAGAAKVSGRLSGTLLCRPFLCPSLGGLLAALEALTALSFPRTRDPPPPHPLASPGRFSCQPGARVQQTHPALQCGEAQRETKKSQAVSQRLPLLRCPPCEEEVSVWGRRNLRNSPSQPTPTLVYQNSGSGFRLGLLFS
uniref:Uncharacterized protein n=1 Tax=Molossus molossus TaxID=27622 RepID=A0A7J8HC18_MOLMO|nr:hypothetical protein HJG59_011170 [Molossus molossus]